MNVKVKIMSGIFGGLMAFTMMASCNLKNSKKDDNKKIYEVITSETEYIVSEQRTPEPVYTKTFSAIGGEGVMPIGVFYGPYTTNNDDSFLNCEKEEFYISDKYFRLLKESGCNLMVASADTYEAYPENVQKALDLSAKYGLGYFVHDSELKYVDEYINHPACAGVHLVDEPTADRFEKIANTIKNFNNGGYGDKVASVNLLPNYGVLYGSEEKFPGMTYEEHVKLWMDMADIEFVSYDHYVFLSATKGVDSVWNYFKNMSIIREEAAAHQIPFWTYVEAGGQWNESGDKDTTYPLFPSEEQFMWKVNTSLMYGAKGIQYFTFMQPQHFDKTADPSVHDYEKNSMVGKAGNLNRWYFYAQKVNKQISAVDKVLMNATNMGVWPIGINAVKNTLDLPEVVNSFRELKSVDCNDVFVGCFDYKGKTALYVVSNSLTEKQSIVLHFDNKYGYQVIQRGVEIEVAAKDLPLTVEKGEGILVVLK